MANPILIEITRGRLVESRHRGAIAIMDGGGKAVLRLGDTAAPVYPRSAVKVLQAIPLLTTGAAQAFGYGNKELALACASHNGEPEHVALATGMLARAGLDAAALECGAHPPMYQPANRALILAGEKPVSLHNNCSGKHAGMLSVSRHLGEDHTGYVRPDHRVQLRIGAIMAELTGTAIADETCAVDGCSVPTWAVPLEATALAFARLASGQGASAELLAAGGRLMTACTAEPGMVAGTKRFCTEVMRALGGGVFVKTGAEGVFCAAIPALGLGIAVKIDDGATRASEMAMAAMLMGLLPQRPDDLARWVAKPLFNVMGNKVGGVGLSDECAKACRELSMAFS